METQEVIDILEKIYADIDKFIKLVGLDYNGDDEEYICLNTDQVDKDWCDREMLESISTVYDDIGFFLNKR